MKPGYLTTEFWLTLLTALPSLAVTIGLVPVADKTILDTAASKIAAGLVAAITVAKYVQSRALVKSAPHLVIFTALLFPGLLSAQQPDTQSSCLLPWRAQIERRLQQLEQQKQPPAQTDPALTTLLQQLLAQNQQILNLLQQRQSPAPAPQYIVLGPQPGPSQSIPLGGPPQQNLPLGGPPQQAMPLGGPPQQNIPLGPAPQQAIPLGGPPRQQIPLESKPLPDQKPMPGATISYQRYSLWRPSPNQNRP
jgi:hypothetical protein